MVGQILAQVGIILFLININMYFIFLVIRKTSVRQVKIRLAKFSRHFMKWHIPIAIWGTVVIVGHAIINLTQIGPLIGFTHLKLLTGYLAFAMLCPTLFAGWLRHKKASGFRRKFHLTTAMTFLGIFVIHMIVLI
ncbi:hypothetical protein [Neobacillus kokaensis]|uniref:Ferric oxidoreductase domain-containing protein n=1 Tax=Neobacillus kokaensis TaxID=2759023 RepID=A0ABQ3NAV1_9BACI|nr:hypothetical protein [Neobacillus kokaensis]GHI00722.1 hypothetical protein AM1BK_42640 [Neobacillus kokaensis]